MTRLDIATQLLAGIVKPLQWNERSTETTAQRALRLADELLEANGTPVDITVQQLCRELAETRVLLDKTTLELQKSQADYRELKASADNSSAWVEIWRKKYDAIVSYLERCNTPKSIMDGVKQIRRMDRSHFESKTGT